MSQYGKRFHHSTQNSVRFKSYKLFISGIFHPMFSGRGGRRVTETMQSEPVDKGGLLCRDDPCHVTEEKATVSAVTDTGPRLDWDRPDCDAKQRTWLRWG